MRSVTPGAAVLVLAMAVASETAHADAFFGPDAVRQIAELIGSGACEVSCETDNPQWTETNYAIQRVRFPARTPPERQEGRRLFLVTETLCGSAGCAGAYVLEAATGVVVILEDRGLGLRRFITAAEIPPPSLARQGMSMQRLADLIRAGNVAAIQARLNELGYAAGPVDGVAGPRTMAALGAFQEDHCLPVNGYITEALVMALAPETLVAAEPPCARRGATASRVALPFPDGFYASDPTFCPGPSGEFAPMMDDRAYGQLIDVSDGGWSWGESACTIRAVRPSTAGLVLDLDCSAEGYRHQNEVAVSEIRSDGFSFFGRRFDLCTGGAGGNDPAPAGSATDADLSRIEAYFSGALGVDSEHVQMSLREAGFLSGPDAPYRPDGRSVLWVPNVESAFRAALEHARLAGVPYDLSTEDGFYRFVEEVSRHRLTPTDGSTLTLDEALEIAVGLLIGDPYGRTREDVLANIAGARVGRDDMCGAEVAWIIDVNVEDVPAMGGQSIRGDLVLDARTGQLVCARLPFLN
jgi:peptidoglycan hydrolase-like protein with peptidoglycan-binding domain